MDEISRALDASLNHVGLPLYPQVPTRIGRTKFDQIIVLFSRALMRKGISLGPDRLSGQIRRRGYYYLPTVARPLQIAPVTIRSRIDEMLTDVLSQRGFPPAQVSYVQLPGYPEVISQTERLLARRGYRPGRLAIALQLQKRRYVPLQPKRPPFEEGAPWNWRLTIPGIPTDELLSTPRGIFTGKSTRVYPLMVRGIG